MPGLTGHLLHSGPSPCPCAGVHKPPGGYPFLRLLFYKLSLWIIKLWYIENQSKSYYYFALEKDGKYYDYYKYYSYEISDGASIKLPSMRQVGTGYYTNATLGGYTWVTVNYGNDKPWSIDTSLYVWPGVDAIAWENSGLTELAERGEAVPTADQFTALYEGTSNYRIRVGGVMGNFFIDTATKGYMFIAASLDEDGHEDGIHVGHPLKMKMKAIELISFGLINGKQPNCFMVVVSKSIVYQFERSNSRALEIHYTKV